ncbi:hypothetical protein WA577_004762 [Blastocystis sp. JDR]
MFSPYRSIRFFSALPGLLIIAILLVEGVPIFTYYVPNITQSRTPLLTCLHCLHLAYFVVCYVFCIWSYFACVFTHPGRVTESYIQDYERQFGYEELRYCPVCNQKKPPRCHHCSICKMCVVNMDHHCPWLCNCIGYANKKFFILFLTYTWLGCFDITLTAFGDIFCLHDSFDLAVHPVSVVAILLAFSISLCLFFFAGFHYWLVLHDKTTIESISSFSRFFSRSPATARRPVHYYENWCSVMDASPWIWLLPVHSASFAFSWDFLFHPSESESDMSMEEMRSLVLHDMRHLQQQLPVPEV